MQIGQSHVHSVHPSLFRSIKDSPMLDKKNRLAMLTSIVTDDGYAFSQSEECLFLCKIHVAVDKSAYIQCIHFFFI